MNCYIGFMLSRLHGTLLDLSDFEILVSTGKVMFGAVGLMNGDYSV